MKRAACPGWKRILAAVLTAALCLGAVPAALATEEPEPAAETLPPEPSAEEILPEEALPVEEPPAEEAPPEESPAEEVSPEEPPAEEVSPEEPPAEEVSPEEPPAEEAPPEESPAEETPAEETPAEETPAEETPAEEEAASGELPAEEDFPVRLDGASVSNAFPFSDVFPAAWYYDGVSYVYYNLLMNGETAAAFRPEGIATRAMVVTVLWRMAGSPAPSGSSGFADVETAWYRDAVAWAKEKGLANGVTAAEFGPDRAVTREQMAAFMARFVRIVYGVDTAVSGSLSAFPDQGKVSDYARADLTWANSVGLITGTTSGSQVVLDPQGTATRAQVATILMRFRQRYPGRSNDGSLEYRIATSATAGKTNQILAVVDHNLTFWERSSAGVWEKKLDVYAGYGANGLSADRREGDKTTPIGAFPLLYAFGRDGNPGTSMTYRQITNRSYYSAEKTGTTYNTWVESPQAISGEHLMDYANLQYRYAIVIGFNIDPVVIGKGSAIFLHCKGSTWNTAGCVSVTQANMLAILDRINNGAWIIIVKNQNDLSAY